MRVLVVGANLAGLLSAQHLRHQGHDVTLLVEGPEVAIQAMPPLFFADSGPWGAEHGALPTLGAMVKDCGDLRLGWDSLSHSGWLAQCLWRRVGGRARSQALQSLAMARRSQVSFDQWQAAAPSPPGLETVAMLSHCPQRRIAKALCPRGPMWHLGSRPRLCDGTALKAVLPHFEDASAQSRRGLVFEGRMLGDTAALLADLRQRLATAGVRFIFDHDIEGVAHAGPYLHSVSVRSRLGQTEDLDLDLAVAASPTLARPLLQALHLKPLLAPVTQWGLRVKLAQAHTGSQWVHDQYSGVRLMRRGTELWAQGPVWLGQPEGSPDQEIAHLSAAITRHFGQRWSALGEGPTQQTHWVAPDGLPLVQRTRLRNLLLNLGHHSSQPIFAFAALALMASLLHTSKPVPKTLAQTQTPWPAGPLPMPATPQGLSHD